MKTILHLIGGLIVATLYYLQLLSPVIALILLLFLGSLCFDKQMFLRWGAMTVFLFICWLLHFDIGVWGTIIASMSMDKVFASQTSVVASNSPALKSNKPGKI